MYNFSLHVDNYFIDNIKRIIRERWRNIKCNTKYGWITAYYQSRKITLENGEILENLAMKIGEENCERAITKIENFSRNRHPKDIPIIAESVLHEMYTIILLRKKSKKDKWKVTKSKRFITRSPIVFTISNNI